MTEIHTTLYVLTAISPYCHTSLLPYCHTILFPYCHTFIFPYHPTSILSYCHTTLLPYSHTIKLPYLQSRPEGEQGVHETPDHLVGRGHVHIYQQRSIGDVLLYGCIVLERCSTGEMQYRIWFSLLWPIVHSEWLQKGEGRCVGDAHSPTLLNLCRYSVSPSRM